MSNKASNPPAGDGPSDAQFILGVIGTIKDRRAGGGMSRGDRAELRRMRHGAFPPEPYWRIVEKYQIAQRDERFWKSVIPLMIDHPHDQSQRPGRALAAAGVSAARLERWLRRDRDSAIEEAGRLLSRLDAGFDWVTFTKLLRYWTERERMQIARDFFLSPEYRERQRKLQNKEAK